MRRQRQGQLRRPWNALLLLLLAAPAFADPTQMVTPPAGWRSDPEQSTALAQRFAATSHLGGLPAVTAAEAYVAGEPGAALFVTRATAALPPSSTPSTPSTPDAPITRAARIARAALDELRASSRRTALTGGMAAERAWQEQVEADRRQVTATLTWSDSTSHTTEAARIVVASDGKRIVAVTGECLASEAADGALAACRAALATLDPGVANRVALALAPGSAPAADPASPSGPAAPAGGAPAIPATGAEQTAAADGQPVLPREAAARSPSAPPREPAAMSPSPPPRESARLDDGSRVMLPPTTIPLDPPTTDRRPVYVGAGVVVLAAMFWWNRRRRDRFEREDRGEPGRPSASAARDADADDLHAAARADGPDAQARPDPEAASQDDRQDHD